MVSKNLARCLAKICGDGHISPKYLRYNNTCKELLDEFEEDIKKEFGDFHLIRGKVNSGTSFIQIQRKEILSVFLSHLNSFKSNDISIPRAVKKSSVDIKIAFIRAFYDDEGCAALRFNKLTQEWKRNINLSSNSFRILSEIKQILSLLKITSNKIHKNNLNNSYDKTHILSISGRNNFKIFREKIGFKHPRKKLILDLILESYSATPRRKPLEFKKLKEKLDLIPVPIKGKSGQLSGSPTHKCSTPRNVCVLNSHMSQVQAQSVFEMGTGVTTQL